jgi:hypothetical protein
MVEKKTKSKQVKLAQATVNLLNDPAQTGVVFGDYSVDYMTLPKKYRDLIKMCRFFYKRDPIAGTIVNKMVDFAITPLMNQKSGCTDDELAVYDSLNEMLIEFYRNVCLEYLLSGLVVPQYEWSRVSGASLTEKLNSRTRVWVPNNIWFRDPSTIIVKSSPIPNRKDYYVQVDAATIQFIKSKGKRPDGTTDTDTYQALVDNYPEFVKAIQAHKGTRLEIKLSDVRPITSKCLPEDPYPVPYMMNALEPLMHKRNLRKMDYSIAARVIAAVQLIKLGSDTFPVTDDGDFTYIKNEINQRTVRGNAERVFQLFANHTLSIEWVAPDTAAMLNREKYSSVEDDIIAGFGFPRTLVTGETLRSNVQGGSDVATFSPIATIEGIRSKLLAWTVDLYKEVKERNKFKNVPIPSFEPIKMYSIIDLNTITRDLYREGSLSRKTRLQLQGIDQNSETERILAEQDKYKEMGIPEAPFVPFSSPTGGFGRAEYDAGLTEFKASNSKGSNKEISGSL